MKARANWNLLIPVALAAILSVMWISLILLSGTGDRFWSHASNEACAVSSLRALHQVNIAYSKGHRDEYAKTLADLLLDETKPIEGISSCKAEALAQNNLKRGYRFFYYATSSATTHRVGSYGITADPSSERTGIRHFFIDETGIIRVSVKGPATATSDPLPD